MESPIFTKRVTASCWSYSRPMVFYLGFSDGTCEVWDLSERSDAASKVRQTFPIPSTRLPPFPQILNISGSAISFMDYVIYKDATHLLVLADNIGTVRMHEVPFSYRVPLTHELKLFTNYVDREISRQNWQIKHNKTEKERIERRAQQQAQEEQERADRQAAEIAAEAAEAARDSAAEGDAKKVAPKDELWDKYLVDAETWQSAVADFDKIGDDTRAESRVNVVRKIAEEKQFTVFENADDLPDVHNDSKIFRREQSQSNMFE